MRVLFRPDLGPALGAGHAMRDLAVAEALVAGGDEVVYACDTTGLRWVEEAILARGCRIVSPDGHLGEIADSETADAVMVDSYILPTSEYETVQARGVPLMAIVDGLRRGARGDVLVDPGPVEPSDWAADLAAGQRVLFGVEYALVRQEFRDMLEGRRPESKPLRVLITFGGTDPYGAAPATAAAVLGLGHPVELTVVVRDDLRHEVSRLRLSAGQRLTTESPGTGFSRLARAHDLVVSAAGSTTWELLAMGVAAGLVCVADNQKRYYQVLPEAGAAVAIGTLRELMSGEPRVAGSLRVLVEDAELRSRLRTSAREAVDGRGGDRVAAEIRRLVAGSAGCGS